ncbi:MAG: hypothetical protein CMO01_12975 [Thalassobius sp.]|nr:hypothetical protein [Thalassovita sp.]
MKGIIKISYRKFIDASSTAVWDKFVFEDTYKEFFMQAQQFDPEGKHETFTEMLKHVPKAENMHYLVSTAAMGYLRQLNDLIPDIANVNGKLFLPFKNFRFEIIQSSTKDKNKHKVAITFFSEAITLIDTIDKHLIISIGDKSDSIDMGLEVNTESLILSDKINICSFQKLTTSVFN